MSAFRGAVGRVWKIMRRTPRLFAAVLTFVVRAPRVVLESGSRVDHHDSVDKHMRQVWARVGSDLRTAAGGESLTVA